MSTQTKAISPHESESEDDSESESIESEEESGDELLSSNLSASSTTYSDLNDSEAPSFFSQTVPSSERALSPSNSAQLAHHPNSLTPSRPSSLCTMSSPAIVPTPPEDSDSGSPFSFFPSFLLFFFFFFLLAHNFLHHNRN